MGYETILYEKSGGIVTITFNRPYKLNALSMELYMEFRDSLDRVEKDNEVKVAVLAGAGERAFCVGDDINDFVGISSSAETKVFFQKILTVFTQLERIGKITIASVNGLCYGGGTEVVTACDLAIASDKATFAVPEARLGLWPAFAVTRWREMMGKKKVMELMFTGDPIDAYEAQRLGLVNKVVPPNRLEAVVGEMATKVMQMAPLPVKLIKVMLNRGLEGTELSSELTSMLFATQDAKEGIEAFLTKRSPGFIGR